MCTVGQIAVSQSSNTSSQSIQQNATWNIHEDITTTFEQNQTQISWYDKILD